MGNCSCSSNAQADIFTEIPSEKVKEDPNFYSPQSFYVQKEHGKDIFNVYDCSELSDRPQTPEELLKSMWLMFKKVKTTKYSTTITLENFAKDAMKGKMGFILYSALVNNNIKVDQFHRIPMSNRDNFNGFIKSRYSTNEDFYYTNHPTHIVKALPSQVVINITYSLRAFSSNSSSFLVNRNYHQVAHAV